MHDSELFPVSWSARKENRKLNVILAVASRMLLSLIAARCFLYMRAFVLILLWINGQKLDSKGENVLVGRNYYYRIRGGSGAIYDEEIWVLFNLRYRFCGKALTLFVPFVEVKTVSPDTRWFIWDNNLINVVLKVIQ